MSDGPHRSLPMRRHWKDLAERAETPAFSTGDMDEALRVALKKEFSEAPLSAIREILGGGDQGSLFQVDCAGQLDEARQACWGSVAGNILIDCAIEANANGVTGDAAFQGALQNALEAHAWSGCHQIEEHHHRKEPHSAPNASKRLRGARDRCSFGALASELMPNKQPVNDTRLRKHTGVDEGPPL